MEDLVYCPKCQRELPRDSFYKNKKRKNGLRSWCKECSKTSNKKNEKKYKETRKRYREKHKDEIKEKKQLYYISNKEKISESNKGYRYSKNGKFFAYKQSAKNRNISWNLTFDEFVLFWQKRCYYCNSEIETIGIDRIDSQSGYEINNCVSCCSTCNKMKLNLEKEVFIESIKSIYEHLKLNKYVESY